MKETNLAKIGCLSFSLLRISLPFQSKHIQFHMYVCTNYLDSMRYLFVQVKMLRAIEEARKNLPIFISSTYCGAHSVPKYVRYVRHVSVFVTL